MKTILANLQSSVSTSLSDLNKTVTSGRALQKTVDGRLVIAPPLTTWADVNTVYGVAPGNCDVNPNTGRKFELQNTNSGIPVVLAFNFNFADGAWVYIGKVTVVLPPGTHSSKGFSFDDSNPNNIKLFFSDTVTTALCQGGTYYTWNLTLADFTPAGTTIFLANDDNQKAVYFAQAPSELGRAHQGITSTGVTGGVDFNVVANQTKFFQINGVAGAMQIYAWDTSIGNPQVDGKVVNGVNCQTTPFAGTSPAAYFSMGASSNGYLTGANSAAAFDAIILKNGTNNIPANFVASTSIQTQYFIRDVQLVSGVWYFNLSTTAVGTAVAPTTSSTAFTMMRANGITSNQFLLKTASISPVLSGALLGANSFVGTVPTNVPANAALNGQDCLALATTTTLYLGRISDLLHGSSSWTSLTPANLLGSGNDIVAPTATLARYSKTLDRWIYNTNTMKFVIKSHVSGSIDRVFGSLINTFYEGQNPIAVPAGVAALTSFSIANGWLFLSSGTTIGQRGVVSCDVYSDSLFDYSYVVTPVMQVEPGAILKYISTIESLFDYTDVMNFSIKSSTNPTDPIFSTNTGWTAIETAADNSPVNLGPYFRIKVTYNTATYGNNTPPQLNDIVVTYLSPDDWSDKWAGDVDHTSRDGETPTKSTAIMKKAYSTSVPKLYFRAYDISGSLVHSADTVTDAAKFDYSTNGGLTWLPVTGGPIPNVVGTLLRYNWTTPPGVNVFPNFREE